MSGSLWRLLIFVTIAFGCSARKEPAPGGESYYPIEAGRYATYDVSRIDYSLTQAPQSRFSVVKEEITEPFTDASGNTANTVLFKSLQPNQSWRHDSSTVVWKSLDKIAGIEHGNVVIKLAIPLNEYNFWNGNAYNTLGECLFKVSGLGKPFLAGSELFPRTVTIIRQNDSTLLSQKRHIEVYAAGVGLIRKEIINLNFCYDTNCKSKGIVTSGYRELSVIKNHGQ